MAERPSAERTAELLFWYARMPSRYQAEGRRRDAPRLDSEVVLKLALGRPVQFADASWREPAKFEALGQAARAYVRQLFFRADATPYQVLGLEPGATPEQIKECFRLLMQLVHPDRQGEKKRWPDACAAQANWAHSMLRDRETRRTFEEEAEARAALQRAINRAAMAAEASRMPAVVWPKKSAKAKFPIRRYVLPEWLTAGVGGFVRRNPAVTAFGTLIAIAVLIVGASLWEGHEGALVRVEREDRVAAAPVAAAPVAASEGSANAAPRQADPKPLQNPTSGGEWAAVPLSATAVADPGRTTASSSPVAPSVVAPPAAAVGLPSAPAAKPAVTATSMPPVTGAAMPPTPSVPIAEMPSPPTTAPRTTPTAAVADVASVAGDRPELAPAPRIAPVSVAIVASSPALAVASPVPTSTPTVGAPGDKEVEALLANFVESYERGRLDAFAQLFDDDADTNLRRGRTAIRGEYDELFRLSQWRRMQLTRISWRPVGDRAIAKGELMVKIGWRDGRQVEQRVDVDMEIVRRDGHVVIAKLSHQPKAP